MSLLQVILNQYSDFNLLTPPTLLQWQTFASALSKSFCKMSSRTEPRTGLLHLFVIKIRDKARPFDCALISKMKAVNSIMCSFIQYSGKPTVSQACTRYPAFQPSNVLFCCMDTGPGPGTLYVFNQQPVLENTLWIIPSCDHWGDQMKWLCTSRVRRRTESHYSWAKDMVPVLESGCKFDPSIIIGLQEHETWRLNSSLSKRIYCDSSSKWGHLPHAWDYLHMNELANQTENPQLIFSHFSDQNENCSF